MEFVLCHLCANVFDLDVGIYKTHFVKPTVSIFTNYEIVERLFGVP